MVWLLGCVGLAGSPASPTCDEDGDGAVMPRCADSASAIDCDDADPDVHPGALELCDGLDNDCSGRPDDPVDGDGDGWSLCLDCDDGDATSHPGGEEVCDGLDNDCSGAADEPFDADGDGFSPCGGDCDDADPLNAGGLSEVCDGRDNNCDGVVDEGFDADGDGWLTCRGDCNDADPTAWYGAPEACDGVDQDCDGVADDLLACWACVDSPPWIWCATPADQGVAADLCGAFAHGLAEIPDEATAASASGLVTANGGGATWMGLDDRDAEGTFVWPSGATVAWTAWASGQPDDAGGQDCVTFDPAASGAWSDEDCDEARPFLCAR